MCWIARIWATNSFVISVFVLGGVSLVFARPIFGLLMRPVLEALPADARSLVYTSGIEEVNVWLILPYQASEQARGRGRGQELPKQTAVLRRRCYAETKP